jgi:integral membrane sensor domain MASE1
MNDGGIQLLYHDYIGLVIALLILGAGLWENYHDDQRSILYLIFGALIVLAFVVVFVPF